MRLFWMVAALTLAALDGTARLEIEGITIFRIVEGKIVEEWNSIDELGLMRQLGAIPKT